MQNETKLAALRSARVWAATLDLAALALVIWLTVYRGLAAGAVFPGLICLFGVGYFLGVCRAALQGTSGTDSLLAPLHDAVCGSAFFVGTAASFTASLVLFAALRPEPAAFFKIVPTALLAGAGLSLLGWLLSRLLLRGSMLLVNRTADEALRAELHALRRSTLLLLAAVMAVTAAAELAIHFFLLAPGDDPVSAAAMRAMNAESFSYFYLFEAAALAFYYYKRKRRLFE